ncbi:pectinesterase-like [Bidens hawaiensis]|uniref:pectinesterase-like n=1 Tax=Bidens hawaiensis TaxID=980011 RepID=UPI00404A4CCC
MHTNNLFTLILSTLFIIITLTLFSHTKITKNPIPLPLFTHPTPHHIHLTKHTQTILTPHTHCNTTRYHTLCIQTLASIAPDLRSKSLPEIISGTINNTVADVRSTDFNVTAIRRRLRNLSAIEIRGLDDCHSLFEDTVTALESAIDGVKRLRYGNVKRYHDVQTLLSAAMTNQDTCLDGFAVGRNRYKVRRYFRQSVRQIARKVSNSLSLLKKVNATSKSVYPVYPVSGGYPHWLRKKDRALLQANDTAVYDLVVAKDGSGNFTTIIDALNAAPNMSTTRFVIYVKAGAYYEYLDIDSRKTMIMLVGEGIGKTTIKGNRSVVDGWTTFRSATVAVTGTNFIAKGITFENFAGTAKHQAVALRSNSDFSVFYQCSFIGYQDTLYVHSFRQFYRECDIYGTIDFIFGNAAVVFQKCNLYARKPDLNQKNLFTAQGRDDPNQNTGISLIECKIAAGSELIPNQTMFKSYLGRPWREYSRTVVMRSYIGDLIDPAGWLEWSGNYSLSTLYYGEYMNRGPGSNTTSRVTWPGYKVIVNSTEAAQFTVGSFIQGDQWLNASGVPYYVGLN